MPGRWLERVACAAVFSVLALASAVTVPAGEAPDELFHVMYAAHIARERRLPIMRPPAMVEVPVEGNQPPLYYLLGAIALRVAGMGELSFGPPPRNPHSTKQGGPEAAVYRHDVRDYPWDSVERATRLLRLMFLPCGAVVVIACHMAATRIWPDDPVRPPLAAGLAATVPQFTFIMASVTNDSLANALAAVGLACILAMAAKGAATARKAAMLGAVAGLGLLTKMTLAFLLPVGALALWRGRDRLRTVGVFVMTAVAVASPILVHYWLEYGDPFGLELNRRMFPQRVHTASLEYFTGTFAPALFFSFWGVFGHMNVHLGKLYVVFATLVALAATGLVIRAADGGWTPTERRVWLPLGTALAGVTAAVVQYNLIFAQPQGRYLFPGLVALTTVFAAGAGELIGRRRGSAVAVILALAGLNGWVLVRVVVPAYTG